MNERIRELMTEAGWLDDTQFSTYNKLHQWQNFDKEKFAELIVKECAHRSYLEDSGNSEVEEALEFWRKDMLKHFGVEE